MVNFRFKAPVKRLILKLGKIFDLENFALDDYQLIILASTNGLVLENLDKFDTAMESHESDSAFYTRTTVPLQLTEIPTGYQVEVEGNNVTVPILNATVQGALIINAATKDILSADLYAGEPVEVISDLNIVFEKPIVVLGEQVCPA